MAFAAYSPVMILLKLILASQFLWAKSSSHVMVPGDTLSIKISGAKKVIVTHSKPIKTHQSPSILSVIAKSPGQTKIIILPGNKTYDISVVSPKSKKFLERPSHYCAILV
jgi:hypothetical protein